MRSLCLLLAGCLALPLPPAALAQERVRTLSLVIIEGEGAINNIRQRTAREPIVQVDDENHKPVAGALVLFELPTRGAGGTFADGSHALRVVTDAQGRAAAHGMIPNNAKGRFQINVTASLNGVTASAAITQSNAVAGASGAATATAGISGKVVAILVVAAAAVAGGAYYATHSGGASGATAPAGATITAGASTVGAPR
jgi:hypothetical protein